jgi:hypothetical protein
MSQPAFAEKSAAQAAKTAGKASSGNLRIGPPDDSFEREADGLADAIMADRPKLNWSLSRMSIAPPLQRKCACGGSGGGSGQCEECKKTETEKSKDKEDDKDKTTLQRKAVGPAESNLAPPVVHEVLNSPGQPLDRATRAFFEPRFGHDFSQVRIHADSRASQSARAVNAIAYTVDQHVVSASQQMSRLTLAHELAHVVQQSNGKLKRTLQRQRCGHDGQPTKCGASMGVWKLVDQATNEAFSYSIDDLVVEGGLKNLGGQWVRQVQTPPNLVKSEKATRGRIDGAKVGVGSTLDVEIVEIKGRSDQGGGCEKATREANGYIGELKTLAPLIVPMSAKLAAVGGLKVEGGRCKTPKAADRKTLQSAGVDFDNDSSVNAWCFYNSLQDRLNRVFTTPFSAVNISANADGAPNRAYDVLPPVVINCRKTKANPSGLGLRFLEFQVNQKGGVSYGCRDLCLPQEEEEKRKAKDVTAEATDETRKADAFQDIDKYNRLELPPAELPPAGVGDKPKAPSDLDVVTPTADTDEEQPAQLPPQGVSEVDQLTTTAEVIATVAILHQAIKALQSPAEKALARKAIEKTIEDGVEKGALTAAKKLDSANLAKYGTREGDLLLKGADEAMVVAAEKSPRLLAKFGPKAIKGLSRVGPIIGIALAANDARAAVSHVMKGGTIELGPSLDDVNLSGDTKVKSSGPAPTTKPSGDVSLKDTKIDIETKTVPNVSGNIDIDADKVTVSGASVSDGSPVTINMKVKLSNTTITFKSNGVVQDGKILAGDLELKDSQVEIDLPPGTLDPGRKADEKTTLTGVKIKVTSLSGGGGAGSAGSGGQGASGGPATPTVTPTTPTVTPATPSTTPGAATGTTAAPPIAGADRPALLDQIKQDPDLHRIYAALAGKEGVVPTDEMLRRFVALKPMIKRHPKAVETVVQNITPGQVTDPIKQIIEPIEQTLSQENAKLAQALGAQAQSGTPGSQQTPATKSGGESSGGPSAQSASTQEKSQETGAKPDDKASTGGGNAGSAVTAKAKATSVKFRDAVARHELVWPSYEPPPGSETKPPDSYTYWIEWRTTVGSATLTYKIPLLLTLKAKLPSGSFQWFAEFDFKAPTGTFTTAEGDLPIQFSDAGQGSYTTKLYTTKPPQKTKKQ